MRSTFGTRNGCKEGDKIIKRWRMEVAKLSPHTLCGPKKKRVSTYLQLFVPMPSKA